MIRVLVFLNVLLAGCFVNGIDQTYLTSSGTHRKLPKTDKPTISPTSFPTRSPTESPTKSFHPTLSPKTKIPSSKPSFTSEAPSFSTSPPSSTIITSSIAIFPMQPFTLGFLYPPSTSVTKINFDLLSDIMQSFLSDYISFRWSSTPHKNSEVTSLDEEEIEILDLYQYQRSQLEIIALPEQRRNLRNSRKLQNSKNQVFPTLFEGQSLIQSPNSDQYKQAKVDPPTFIQEERILLALELKLLQLQEEALTQHLGSLLELLQSNTVGDNHEVLSSITSIVTLDTDTDLEDLVTDVVEVENDKINENNENKENDQINSPPTTVDKAGTEFVGSSNPSPNSNKMIITMAIITGVLGMIVIFGSMKVYQKRKNKRAKGMRRKEASTANNTEERDDFSEVLDIYEIKHQINRSTNNSKKKKPKSQGDDEDFDDMSSIGMGTAIFNPKRHKNEYGDDVSQISLDYSMDGQSIETKKIPKYARSDHSIDGDDDTTFHEAKLLTTESRSPRRVRIDSQSTDAASTSQNQQPHVLKSQSSFKSYADTESVWTFSRMGNDETLEEGVEIESVLMRPQNSYDEEDESLYGFTKFTAKDKDDPNDSYSHVGQSPNKSMASISTQNTTPRHKTPNNPSNRYSEESFSSIDGPKRETLQNSNEIEKSFSSIDGVPDSWKKTNVATKVTDFFSPNFFPSKQTDPFHEQQRQHLSQSSKATPGIKKTLDDQSETPSDEYTRENDNKKSESSSIMNDLNTLRNALNPRKDPKRDWRNSSYARSRHMWQ